jgi:hypothetical protein
MARFWGCDGTGDVLAHLASALEEPRAGTVSDRGHRGGRAPGVRTFPTGTALARIAQEDAPVEPPARRTTVEDVFIDLRVPEDQATVPTALRVPIRARTRPVGTLWLVGPRAGDCTRDERRRLAAFADEIGIAHVTFLLRDSPHPAATWGQVRTCVGIGLAMIGLALVLGAAWALGARALPLSWLPWRPGVWTGACLTATGVLLAGVRR